MSKISAILMCSSLLIWPSLALSSPEECRKLLESSPGGSTPEKQQLYRELKERSHGLLDQFRSQYNAGTPFNPAFKDELQATLDELETVEEILGYGSFETENLLVHLEQISVLIELSGVVLEVTDLNKKKKSLSHWAEEILTTRNYETADAFLKQYYHFKKQILLFKIIHPHGVFETEKLEEISNKIEMRMG